MKLFALTLLLSASLQVQGFGFEIEEIWKVNGQKKNLRIRCDATNGAICAHVCNNTFACDVPEEFCRDCAGSSQGALLDFFKNVGRTYVSESIETQPTALATLLNSKQYASFTPKTPLNFWFGSDGRELRARLQLLCPQDDANPIVFFRVDEHRRPTRPWFVACASETQVTLRRVIRKLSNGDDSRPIPMENNSAFEIRKALLP